MFQQRNLLPVPLPLHWCRSLQDDSDDVTDSVPTLAQAVAHEMLQQQATEMILQRSWRIDSNEGSAVSTWHNQHGRLRCSTNSRHLQHPDLWLLLCQECQH